MTKPSKKPGLAATPKGVEDFLYYIAIAFLLIGFLAGFATWSEYSYPIAITFMFSGVVSFASFLAVSKILANQRKLLWMLSDENTFFQVFEMSPPKMGSPKSSEQLQKTKTSKYGEDFPQY